MIDKTNELIKYNFENESKTRIQYKKCVWSGPYRC